MKGMIYRDKLSSELIDLLKQETSSSELILICDALLARKESIRGFKQPFESLFNSLTRKQLRQLELIDDKLSPATVHALFYEMQHRGMATAKWFAMINMEQKGPMNRMELESILQKQDNDLLVWKEGTKDWVKSSGIESLNTDYYFDQEINESLEPSKPTFNRKNNVDRASNTWLLIGLSQLLLAIPFWTIMIFGSFFSGFNSVTGPVLPFIFSISMVILSIPMGIALIKGAKWAYQTRVSTGIIGLLLFGSRYFIDDGSILWLLFFFFEFIFLSLTIAYAESKRPKFA